MNIIINFIVENWILLSLELLSGFFYYLFNEFEDRSKDDKWKNPMWNTKDSWRNKWRWHYGIRVDYIKCWYHFWVYPDYKEEFPYSSTILVFLTDKEHFFQLLKNLFILIAIGLISWSFMISFLIGRLLMSFIKEKFIKWLS